MLFELLVADAGGAFAMSMPTAGSVIAIVTALFLLALSGFISASETAFFSLTPEELAQVDSQDTPHSKAVSALIADRERLLATILTVNNLVNVAIVLLLDLAFAQMISFGAEWLEFLVITVLLTFILIHNIYVQYYQIKFQFQNYLRH